MTKLPPIRLSLLLCVALAAACSQVTSDPLLLPPDADGGTVVTGSDLDGFLRSLPGWDDASPPVVERDEPVAEPADLPEELASDGTSWRCISTTYEMARNPDEIAMAAPDAAVVWPGALVRGDSHLDRGDLELLALRRERRAPMGMSIQGGGVLGIRGGVSTVIEQPVGSTVREGVNQLVANALDAEVAVGAGTSSFSSVETFASEQAMLALGFDARYLGASLGGDLEVERQVDEHTLTATFVQRLFTVSVDAPETSADFFAPGVSAEDLQAVGIGPDNLPLYIDSVSYGRMLVVSFTSRDSVERMEAALAFAYDGVVAEGSAYAELELQETLSSARLEVFALGGPNTGVEALIARGQLADYFDGSFEINQVEPIAFTVRNLGDNRLASVGSTTRYEREQCEEVVAPLPEPNHWWTGEGAADAAGDLDVVRLISSPELTEGRYGRGLAFDGRGLDAVMTRGGVSPVRTDAGFTISAWVYPGSTGGHMTIAAVMGPDERIGDFQVRLSPNRALQFFRRPVNGTSTVDLVQTAGEAVPLARWSHVTAVYGMGADEEATMRLYVNGVLVADRSAPDNYGGAATTRVFTIGGGDQILFAFRWPYAGTIDEVMTFDRALSSDEVFIHHDRFADYLTSP